YTAPAFTDLDGDGDLDLLAGHDAGKIIYFEDTTSCAPPNVATTIAGVTITAAFAGADSYQWVVCPGMAVAAGVSTNQSYTATTNGDYAVIITEMGCSDTSACVTINSVGISEWTDENEISVFPNPNNGSFTISGVTDANLLFLLQNETGQVVQRIRLNPNNNYHFTVENLANGVYFIRQEGSGLNKRIVVIK
ncbi:MAG TPA: T9SS type A sorting domain-containing protein, partial [Flavobacteriales bacterium]|nr:T9SS type A sorting domain-containing protein [Flavobacteriales bacterium]